MFSWLKGKFKGESKKDINDWLSKLEVPEQTPDVIKLSSRPYWLLFLYDEHMSRHPRNIVFKDDEKKATAFTEDNFTLFKKKLGQGTFPFALEKRYESSRFSPIKGEVWLVPYDTLFLLDTVKENGVQFQRERRRVLVPYREVRFLHNLDYSQENLNSTYVTPEQLIPLNVWMYVGCINYWDHLLDGGYEFGSVGVYHPRLSSILKPYYHFTRMEYVE